ncbi:unnamed protein product, partial [Allacma fusca]
IKTNGSLPREKKSTSTESSKSYRTNSNTTAAADDEIASIFTFSPTDGIPNDVFLPSNSTPTSSSANRIAPFQQGIDETDKSLVRAKTGFRNVVKSPYENVVAVVQPILSTDSPVIPNPTDPNTNFPSAATTPTEPQSPRTKIRTTLSSKTTNLNDTNNSPNSNYIRRPILTT